MGNARKERIQFNTPSNIYVVKNGCPVTYPPHWHNAAEFTIILKDGCRYRVSDTFYELKKGDVLLIWPHQIHETVSIPDNAALFVQFSSAIIENSLDLVSISRFLYDCHYISASKEPELAKYITQKILEIKKIHELSDPLSETQCKLCIYDILLKIGNHVLDEAKKETSDDLVSRKRSWKYIHAACNYIMESSSDNITQSEVAKEIGLSTYYFSKLFKQHMNMSFPAYLANIRVRSAASLLLDESISITECAFQAGFQSTTAFNKTFHDITGYSPREYRKLYKQ